MQSGLKSRWHSTLTMAQHVLHQRVVWIADQRRDFVGEVSAKTALVAFIGKEHYREHRRRYPVQSRIELMRILRLEAQAGVTALLHIGPANPEGRWVTRYELKPLAAHLMPAALLWIPETLALSKALPGASYFEVMRGSLRYFVTADGRSQLAGGAIIDGSQFALAAGLGANTTAINLGPEAVSPHLLRGLRSLSVSEFLEFVSRDLLSSALQLLRPLSLGAAVFVLGYLVLSSAYLLGFNQLRSWQLTQVEAEVAPLFVSERKLDALTRQSAAVAALLDARFESWPMWEIIPRIWEKNGFVTGIVLDDDELLLRGRAPSAVEILEAIAKSPGVSAARFESGVRQNQGQEEFSIVLRMGAPKASPR
jgi:hypothetical protein